MLCAMALMTGCSQEEYDDNGQLAPSGNFTLTASTGSNSRTSVADNFNVNWTSGDAIFVYGGTNTSGTLALEGEGGSTTGTFKGTVTGTPADLQYAVYPADGFAKSQAKPTTFTFPATYEYPATGSMASNSPMFGKVENSDGAQSVAFTQHLAGMIRITLNDVPANSTNNSLTLKGTGVAGTYTLTVADGNASLASSATAGQSASDEVSVSFNSKNGNLVFDIPVPAGTYTAGLSVELKMGEATANIYRIENKTVTAGKIILMPAINNITLDGSTIGFTQETADEKDAQEALDKGVTNVAIAEVDASSEPATLKIPATANDEPTTITLASLNTGDSNTLTIEAKESNTVDQPVNINLDNSGTSNTASLVIELPNSHVTLAPVGGTTVIDKVVSNSSATTLVVEAGVTVKELIIKGGNVEVRGIVEKLSREASNTAIVAVASFGAADIKEVTNPENFTFTSTWDGISKTSAKYANIYTAAQFAAYQSITAPNDGTATKLAATFDADATLHADLNLDNKPFLGMVIRDKDFDGGKHTISNLNMSQYILNEQSIYTPDACVALFAGVYGTVTIKDLTLKNVTIKPAAPKSPKWVGALAGYSYGTITYTNCIAENVDIYTQGGSSYRVGGLIGFIANSGSADKRTTLTGCEVHTAKIAASFSYGGLVGSMQGNATFNQCKTSDITLSLNNVPGWYGYVSHFIGDIASEAVGYNREIIITNCETQDFTQQDAFHFDQVVAQQGSSYLSGTFKGGCKWCGLVEPKAGVLDGDKFKITVDGTALVRGTDYNVCE